MSIYFRGSMPKDGLAAICIYDSYLSLYHDFLVIFGRRACFQG